MPLIYVNVTNNVIMLHHIAYSLFLTMASVRPEPAKVVGLTAGALIDALLRMSRAAVHVGQKYVA